MRDGLIHGEKHKTGKVVERRYDGHRPGVHFLSGESPFVVARWCSVFFSISVLCVCLAPLDSSTLLFDVASYLAMYRQSIIDDQLFWEAFCFPFTNKTFS